MKIVVYLLIVVLMIALGITVFMGRCVSKRKKAGQQATSKRDWHAFFGKAVLVIIGAILAVVEITNVARYGIHRRQYPPHFLWHLSGAVVFSLLALVVVTRITGDRYPKIHRWLVYPCAALGFVTSIGGFFITYRW